MLPETTPLVIRKHQTLAKKVRIIDEGHQPTGERSFRVAMSSFGQMLSLILARKTAAGITAASLYHLKIYHLTAKMRARMLHRAAEATASMAPSSP